MVFETGKLIVIKPTPVVFATVEDVPGYRELVDLGLAPVINFIQNNLANVDLCLQAAELKQAGLAVYNTDKKLIAINGWRVKQTLGSGKDGITILGSRYSDQLKTVKTVKILSKYGKEYLNHTDLFNEILKKTKKKNKHFFPLAVNHDCTYYNSSLPLMQVEDLRKALISLCGINHWIIKNTGFVIWDFGFGSGKNYMQTESGMLKWIDYGGAGILRCSNFDYIINKHKDLPELKLVEPRAGKESLLVADSKFVKCQFLLHIEYWLANQNSNADIWSSMLQIRRSIIDEIDSVLPDILKSNLAKSIYKDFSNYDWTDEITWKKLGKYIHANT